MANMGGDTVGCYGNGGVGCFDMEGGEMSEEIIQGPWEIGYDNDTGPNDEGFWEWITVGPVRIDIPCNDPAGAKQADDIAHAVSALPDMVAAIKATLAAWAPCVDDPNYAEQSKAQDALVAALKKAGVSP